MAQKIKRVILKIYDGKRFVTKYELAKRLYNLFPNLFFGPIYLCDNNSYYGLAFVYIRLCLIYNGPIEHRPYLTKELDDKVIYHFQLLPQI